VSTNLFLRALLVQAALTSSCTNETRPVRDAATSHDAAKAQDAGDASAPALKLVRSIVTSPTHSCALRKAGLYCWGENFKGQLGSGDMLDSMAPVKAQVVTDDIVELVAAGGRTCVRRSTGKVACWGDNEQGEIGDGTRTDALVPVELSGIDDARALAIQDYSTCVVRGAEGRVACWGLSPKESPTEGSLTPLDIDGISEVVELSPGAFGSYCGRGKPGWVKCWQFEEGSFTAPVEVHALAGASAIGMTFRDEVCALIEPDKVLCSNLDSGNTAPLSNAEGTVELVAAGALAACGRNTAGTWRCWNVLPTMLESVGSTPIEIPSDVPLTELFLSGFELCALRADHRVACANANEGLFSLRVVEGLPD
jgi:hypothetical protein